MSDLEQGRPGRIGKVTPAHFAGSHAHDNHAPTAQATISGTGWLALVFAVIALALAFGVLFAIWRISSEVNALRADVSSALAAAAHASTAADGAVNMAQLSERNAKLAQYQLEEAIKARGVSIPKEPQPDARH